MTTRRKDIRILTISVSNTRTTAHDESGQLLQQLLREAGFTLLPHLVLRTEESYIQDRLRQAASDNEAECVIFVGGTGIGQHDITPEAVEGVLEKRIEGFGEAMRRLSFEQVGPFGMLTRATAGLLQQCVVFVIPSRPNAVRLGAEKLIVPVLEHMVDLALGRASVLPPPPYV